jgi:hypothetical protein
MQQKDNGWLLPGVPLINASGSACTPTPTENVNPERQRLTIAVKTHPSMLSHRSSTVGASSA